MRKYIARFLPHIGCAFFFSMFINVLQLSYLFYLRLLFDKVMTSRSGETLFYLTAAVIAAYVVMGVLEVIRSKLLVRVGVKFDQVVAGRVFGQMLDNSVQAGSAKHTQGLKDLNSIRNFFGGTGIFAFFDTPWVPVYLALIFMFHSWLGYIACAGALVLLLLVLAQEILTARMRNRHAQSSMSTDQFLTSTMRNSQSVHAMGMLPALSRLWRHYNTRDVYYEDKLAARTGFFQSLAKLTQMLTVVIIMSTGAYLVVIHEATIGTMVAASMIMSRALAPILMLGNAWKSLVEARLAYTRLNELMDVSGEESRQAVPQAADQFEASGITHSIHGHHVLQDISFRVDPGEVLAVIGPSGAGKSTLARVLLGLWKPDSGQIRLGQGEIADLDRAELGSKTGYLPQEVELFSGTVAENIARLGPVDSGAVVEAAMQAGAHQMILGLPQGYDTPIGQGGIALSGGQKQRIALARALYGNPWLIVLDEPDSHLDQPGREALKRLLDKLKEQGRFLILISHNQELSNLADKALELRNGLMAAAQPPAKAGLES
ncbi:MAG: type I secretion system permease/ATPase [Desulfovermiculus sp.]